MTHTAKPPEIVADAQRAVEMLTTIGVLAKNEEEAHLLSLWREVQEEKDKKYCLGVLTGLTVKS